MDFRSRLIATLRTIEPVLQVPDVVVIGSEVPNLLESGAASTLVVSQDVDIGVPVARHAEVKAKLREVRGLRPSEDEPSVWVPEPPGTDRIEVNFVGIDPGIRDASETYVLEDAELPLLVFGTLSFVVRGREIEVEGLRVPLPRPAGLLLEKLLSERTGEKGDRDLLVVMGLLLVAEEADLIELDRAYQGLPPDLRHAVRSNLSVLSLLGKLEGMPDPTLHRAKIAKLLSRLEESETDR